MIVHIKKIRFTKMLCLIYKMSSSERIKELKIASTLWADPRRIINLHDFDPKKIKYLYRTE